MLQKILNITSTISMVSSHHEIMEISVKDIRKWLKSGSVHVFVDQ